MTILDDIRAYKLGEIETGKSERPLADLEAEANHVSPPRGFAEALRHAYRIGGYGLIAEIKKASPSKGLIREDFDPAELAYAYQEGGATCLSVLTDTPSFQGHNSYLTLARNTVSLPVLRKDFMFDPWQIVQSRALGADCILIILAAVSDAQAHELETVANDWGMDVLLEVHTAEELERAKLLKSPLIGINNRNLNTFETDIDTTRGLARAVPVDRIIISESGMSDRLDLALMARYGVRCFLIGETLMREADVESATREMLRSPWRPEAE